MFVVRTFWSRRAALPLRRHWAANVTLAEHMGNRLSPGDPVPHEEHLRIARRTTTSFEAASRGAPVRDRPRARPFSDLRLRLRAASAGRVVLEPSLKALMRPAARGCRRDTPKGTPEEALCSCLAGAGQPRGRPAPAVLLLRQEHGPTEASPNRSMPSLIGWTPCTSSRHGTNGVTGDSASVGRSVWKSFSMRVITS
jgi:hypothetical protein